MINYNLLSISRCLNIDEDKLHNLTDHEVAGLCLSAIKVLQGRLDRCNKSYVKLQRENLAFRQLPLFGQGGKN